MVPALAETGLPAGAFHVRLAGEFLGQGHGQGRRTDRVQRFGFGDGIVRQPYGLRFVQGGRFPALEQQDPLAHAERDDDGDQDHEEGR